MNRISDKYEAIFNGPAMEQKFFEEVQQMDDNSEWVPNIKIREVRLQDIADGFEEYKAITQYKVAPEVAEDTRLNGTRILVNAIEGQRVYCCNRIFIENMKQLLQINGAALVRMEKIPPALCLCLNEAAKVYREGEKSLRGLILVRYGKATGFHSSGYRIIKISDLLKTTHQEVSKRCGQMNFISGYNSHASTSATWTLPEMEARINKQLQAKLKAISPYNKLRVEVTPSVYFRSSDTSDSSAVLVPVFRRKDNHQILGYNPQNCVRVKHQGVTDGIAEYTSEMNNLFTLFCELCDSYADLASIELDVNNHQNIIISCCNAFGIDRKYGEAAREDLERVCTGASRLTALDVMYSLSAALSSAEANNASPSELERIQLGICRIFTTDWRHHDVGGVVAWANEKKPNRKVAAAAA